MASTGIRAEIAIHSPDSCPIATVSQEAQTSSRAVSTSTGGIGGETVTEEFVLDADVEVDRGDVERVFSYGGSDVYRFERGRGIDCPCAVIEKHNCPVVDVTAREGTLHLVFHAPDVARLQAVVSDYQASFDDVEVRRLLRSSGHESEQDLVIVDCSELTDRQREVLETAHEMGYFDHPKGANAGEVADALDITTSTFTEHLSAVQTKLFSAIVAD